MVNPDADGGGGGGSDSGSLDSLVEDLIDTEDGSPRLRIGALLTTIVATVAYAFELGFIGLVNAIRGGLGGTAGDLGAWVSGEDGLIEALFAIPGEAFDAAFAATAGVIGSAGVFAQLLAVVELMAIAAFFGWLLTGIVSAILGGGT